MTQCLFKSKVYRRILQVSLVALAIAAPLTPVLEQPAQAGFLGSFKGNRGGGRASGRARGGAVRDSACAVATPLSTPAQDSEQQEEQIFTLVVEGQQQTTRANPDFFVYVPFDRNTEDMGLVFELATQEAITGRQVVATANLPLPEKAGLVRFQLPTDTPLALGTTYNWGFRLQCLSQPSTPEAEPQIATPSTQTGSGPVTAGNLSISILSPTHGTSKAKNTPTPRVLQEVFGDIQRVEATPELKATLANSEPEQQYQAYLEQGIWFDMVSDLAANSPSDWTTFLQEMGEDPNFRELATVDPNPEVVTPES